MLSEPAFCTCLHCVHREAFGSFEGKIIDLTTSEGIERGTEERTSTGVEEQNGRTKRRRGSGEERKGGEEREWEERKGGEERVRRRGKEGRRE
ncbi:hypothetical protein NHX12_009478 [Muraenolepis orangiensis]|uniref:Uncharacterized protein n=1 Tax=Muraenolepis orangiensis TaxID=630683 RepID=A0A9Q0I7G8_9TELE|nr:hypothetical protein NHX12_009478 [Muraenolepis orangiensis]